MLTVRLQQPNTSTNANPAYRRNRSNTIEREKAIEALGELALLTPSRKPFYEIFQN
jgi:hypothetical protein